MTLNSKIIPVRTFNGSATVAEPFPSELATIPNLQAFFCADYNTVSSGNTQQTWTNINGTLVAGLSGTFQAPTGSNTSNTNSLSMSIGAIDTSTNRLNGGIALVLFGTGYWATATIGSETVEEYITRVCGSYYGLDVS